MILTRYVKYGILSGLLLLCTILLTTTEDSQRSALAQITPASEKLAGNDHSATSSSPVANNPITPSPNPSNDASEQDTTSTDEQDDSISDSNDATSEEQVDGATTTENADSDPTVTLVESITKQVNEALSASGITLP